MKFPLQLFVSLCCLFQARSFRALRPIVGSNKLISSSRRPFSRRDHASNPNPMSKNTALFGWGDEDLPNILGINPIEGAILVAALYYFYGPNTLYEYAREAGRFFSTYAPIVRDVSLDIFYEFRDYLEEDREREMLRRQGVDVNRMPRRTTNIIERFQQSMEQFAPESDKDSMGSNLGLADDDDYDDSASKISSIIRERDSSSAAVATSAAAVGAAAIGAAESSSLRKKRKSKKEMLNEKNVEQQAEKEENVEDDSEALSKATALASMMREAEAAEEGMGAYKSFVMPTSEDEISGSGAAAGSVKPWENNGVDVDDDITDIWSRPSTPSQSSVALSQSQFAASTAAAATASATGAADISAALSMSKFQQQLSGQWNERVLRKEQYSAGTDDASATASVSPFSPAVPSPAATTAGSTGSVFPYDSSSAFTGATSASNNRYGSMIGVEPSTLPPPFSDLPLAAGDDGSDDGGKFIPLPTSIPVDPDAELAEVLAEIDKDYNALRSKLVRLIEARGKGVVMKQDDPVVQVPEEL